MREPSGENTGSLSSAAFEVSCFCPLPSRFITQMSMLPARAEAKTIRSPSGEKLAKRSAPRDVVSCFSADPSGLTA
jgi:hypothetical protein